VSPISTLFCDWFLSMKPPNVSTKCLPQVVQCPHLVARWLQWKIPCTPKPHHLFSPMRTSHHHLLHLPPSNPLSSLCMQSQCLLKELLYLPFYTSWSRSLLTYNTSLSTIEITP
jgi:hypothetical protein